jgi:hypothetical protein
MLINGHLRALGIVTVCFLGCRGADAQESLPDLATVKTIKCSFPLLATGTWKNGKAEAAVMPARLSLEFDPVDVDGGTAVLLANDGGDAGKSDVFVRLSKGTLHVVQMFADGPLYTTTIFPTETRAGKLQAVHTRHEFTAGISLPGFTWQPEQYYGECEVHR